MQLKTDKPAEACLTAAQQHLWATDPVPPALPSLSALQLKTGSRLDARLMAALQHLQAALQLPERHALDAAALRCTQMLARAAPLTQDLQQLADCAERKEDWKYFACLLPLYQEVRQGWQPHA